MQRFNTSAVIRLAQSMAFSLVLVVFLAQPVVAQKVNFLEKKATVSTELIAKEMELTEEQKTLLMEALVQRYQHTSGKVTKDLSKDEKKKLFQAARQAQADTLAANFSAEEIKQVDELLKKARAKKKAASKGNPLFNGKNLNGWEQVNGTATYEIVDGAILGTTVAGSPNSFLATKKSFANFELQFEVFLMNNELNSGVQFRSAQHTDESLKTSKKKHPVGRVYGYQCEIEASVDGDMDAKKYGDAGYIYDEARRGWLVNDETRLAATTRGAFKNKSWNKFRILCNGDHIQTWINGEKICDIKDDMTASGFIALQVHGIGKRDEKWQVKWKNITIKEFPKN